MTPTLTHRVLPPTELPLPSNPWRDLLPGDRVIVSGEPTKSVFHFQRVTARDGVVTDVHVFGGLPHRERLRAFVPDRITYPRENQP